MTDDPLLPLLDLPGVPDAIDRARAGVDALLGNRMLRKRSGDVSAESSLRGAWASADLAAATMPGRAPIVLDDVRSGSAAADPLVQGALRAQAALAGLADTWTHAPRQVLARLHVLAAADLVDDPEALGRPRAIAAARLDTLAAVLAATSVPAVVVAGIVHAEVLSLDAFAPASGIVARAAVRLTLIDRGLDPKSLVVVEAGHRELRPQYDAALTAYRTGTKDGIATWLVHCADAVTAGALETTAICQALARA